MACCRPAPRTPANLLGVFRTENAATTGLAVAIGALVSLSQKFVWQFLPPKMTGSRIVRSFVHASLRKVDPSGLEWTRVDAGPPVKSPILILRRVDPSGPEWTRSGFGLKSNCPY